VHAQSFSTMTVFDRDGCARARVGEEPPSPDYSRQHFDWRDYLKDTPVAGVPMVPYVRAAYRSSVSKNVKFAISAPLMVNGSWVGVVTGSMTAASTLELPRTNRIGTKDQLTACRASGEARMRGQT